MFSYEGILAKLQAMVIQNKRDVTIFITKFKVKWQVAITRLKIYGTLQEIKKYQDTIQKLENNYCSNNVIITFNLLGLRCKLKVKMCDSHLKLPVFNK